MLFIEHLFCAKCSGIVEVHVGARLGNGWREDIEVKIQWAVLPDLEETEDAEG